MRPPNICVYCKHAREKFTCVPFPDGIPRAIQQVEIYHLDSFPNDNGIRFEAREDAPHWAKNLEVIKPRD